MEGGQRNPKPRYGRGSDSKVTIQTFPIPISNLFRLLSQLLPLSCRPPATQPTYLHSRHSGGIQRVSTDSRVHQIGGREKARERKRQRKRQDRPRPRQTLILETCEFIHIMQISIKEEAAKSNCLLLQSVVEYCIVDGETISTSTR